MLLPDKSLDKLSDQTVKSLSEKSPECSANQIAEIVGAILPSKFQPGDKVSSSFMSGKKRFIGWVLEATKNYHNQYVYTVVEPNNEGNVYWFREESELHLLKKFKLEDYE